jgi:putative transcriptional regulator
MDQRMRLVAGAREALVAAGFVTTDPADLLHSSFDLVARRDAAIVILKAVLNANSIGDGALSGMQTLARAVGGSALIIGIRAGDEPIEDGVMYTRAGIPLVSAGTFRDLVVDGVPPLVYAASGGFYVNVDSEALRKARHGGLSLGDLAEMAGVSRRTIRMYEDGMGANLEIALRLESGLGVELILPADPLACRVSEDGPAPEDGFEGIAGDVFGKLGEIGYRVERADRCPFDAVTHDEIVLLLTAVDQRRPGLDRRARAITALSRILRKHSVIFVDRLGGRKNLEGAPLIGCAELRLVKDRKKVMELVEERE